MRLKIETFGAGDTSWLDSGHGTDNAATGTIVLADFTKATHYPDGYIPSGLPVDATYRAALKPWTAESTGVLGFVLFDQPADDATNLAVPVLLHGRVRVERLPVAFTVPADAPGFVFNEESDS